MNVSLHQWRRGPRTNFLLSTKPGVYALFLRDGAELPTLISGERGLIYIGLAANRKGLKGRCHFAGRTRNHSPRKSLAVLLMGELALAPILIPKPNSPATWGLDASSEKKLSCWMHSHLELAIELCNEPDTRETELVNHYAPALNLTKCLQNAQHQHVLHLRRKVLASLQEHVERNSETHSAVGRTSAIGKP